MSKRLIQLAIVCTVAALVTSCASPTYKFYEGTYKLYEGTPSPPDKIATLLTTFGSYVVTIDGFPPPDSRQAFSGSAWDGSLRIELLPGEHTISVGFDFVLGRGQEMWSVGQKMITFHVEAGKVYVVVIDCNSARTNWNVRVEEVPKRGVIPQVTQPDRAAEIYFIREWAFTGAAVKPNLIFDGVASLPLGAGKYTMIKADPGKHLVGVWELDAMIGFNEEFDFQPNQKYYFAIKMIYVIHKPFEIILLSTSDGEAAVKKCTYVPLYVPVKSQ